MVGTSPTLTADPAPRPPPPGDQRQRRPAELAVELPPLGTDRVQVRSHRTGVATCDRPRRGFARDLDRPQLQRASASSAWPRSTPARSISSTATWVSVTR